MTNDEFKRPLWDPADEHRGPVAATRYKYPVLGPVILKSVSRMYAHSEAIGASIADPNSVYYIEDVDTPQEMEGRIELSLVCEEPVK